MAYIGSFPADKTSGSKPRDEFVGDNSTTEFVLSQEVPGGFESNVLVIVDNVIQQPVESYTIAGDNITLTFSEAPATDAVIYVLHQGNATYQMVPVVGSVTPDKLSENLRNFTVDTFTGDGSTVDYTLTATPASANSILVIVDGIVQTKTTNYTLASTTLTFTGAPDNGAAITVIHLGFSTVSRTVVPDGSITTAKIADNAITSAKLAFDVIVAEDIAANAITVSELQNGAVTPAKLSTGGPAWDSSSNFGVGTATPVANSNQKSVTINGTSFSRVDFQVGGSNTAYLYSGASNTNFGTTGSTFIAFDTNSTERMRITSGGLVGIGKTAPDYSFDVQRNANDSLTRVNAQNPNAGSSAVTILGMGNDQTSTGAGLKLGSSTWSSGANTVEIFNNLAGSIFFSTQGTERIRIPSDAGGIKFPATQVASSDPNTLDDYEEGTWTPIDASGAGLTLTVNTTSNYVKIGRMVYAVCSVTYPSTGSGAGAAIGGLPFTSDGSSGGFWGGITRYTGNSVVVMAANNPSSTSFALYLGGGSQASNSYVSNIRYDFIFTYKAAS